ncbi:LOW QUALITY PROTEIN: TBC1 domain family member 12 [Manduca sexta]|uniref:LOW QUALITY PROTEIN: TBC1 domain family member 12 n=1 Tax=Manduca sexta TaxID=7130 RepID=UPI00188E25D1|nr:LOW QUALITY PROTEIN: TBC1 domain family member 12 [Manduca sexta]
MSSPCKKGGMRLSEALDNMQLAYNPITKQLHFVSPKIVKSSENTADDVDKLSKKSSFSDEGNFSISTCEKSDTSDSPKSTLQWGSVNGHQREKDGGSFSSTVSSLSECSLGSGASKEDEVPDVASAEQDHTKLKKKGLSGFFSRGVFPWKSSSSSKNHESSTPTVSWRLFGSKSSGNISTKNLTSENPNSLTPVSSATNTPHHHKRQGSSASDKQFDDLVASSIALIQHDRPSNLPAKCTEEALRHKAEHARMVEAARRRVEREVAARHAKLQESLRQEERLARHAREWTQTILPDWQNMKNAKRTLELWWCGLPPAVRGKVWQLAIGNKLKITHEMYQDYVAKAKQKLQEAQLRRKRLKVNQGCGCVPRKDKAKFDDVLPTDTKKDKKDDEKRLGIPRNFSEQNLKSHTEDSEPKKCCSKSNPDLLDYGDECSMELIQLDIARTFPHLCIFQRGGPYFDVLHELLAAYVCYRPDIGYVQGMSFIAAVLILNMEAAPAFVCFANLLDGCVLRAAFTRDGATMQRLWKAYGRLVETNIPALADGALLPELYLLEWLYTAFAKAMPLDAACRLWDVFLRDGDTFLFNAALGILHLYQDELKDMDFISAAQFLTKLPEDLDAEALFKSISSVSMCCDGMSFEELVSCCEVDSSLDDDVAVRL